MNSYHKIGKQWHIFQLNVEVISRSKCDDLAKLFQELEVDIAVIQETHTQSKEDLSKRGVISGFKIVASEDSAAHGIVTYVKNTLVDSSDFIESKAENNIYQTTVCVNNIYVTNVYKSPAAQWTQSAILKSYPHPALYLGDFNSHHQEWSYDQNDFNGEVLVDWASKNSLHLAFDAKDEKTFFSQAHQRGYNPDLCFVSCDNEGNPLPTSRYVLSAFPNSQHRPILYQIGLKIPIVTSIPRPRWNFGKANWTEFKQNMEDTIRFIKPKGSNYERFLKLLISNAKKIDTKRIP